MLHHYIHGKTKGLRNWGQGEGGGGGGGGGGG